MKKQVEIERKYIIEMPDISVLKNQPYYTESDIMQIYLSSDGKSTRRIRSRAYPEYTAYTETVKRRIDSMSAIEEEREISSSEFNLLKKEFKEGTRPILKTRHTFVCDGRTLEIDVYPDWKSSAVMEIELETREINPKFPPFIKVISEVTGDFRYSNASMAREFPKEII